MTVPGTSSAAPPSAAPPSAGPSPAAAGIAQVRVPAADWWRHAVVYQIYPRSFADGDGDGLGDLPGITGRLVALQYLGVDAIWLSPFYASPQADAGYDVADYRDVDPRFGTLADFDALLQTAHDLGIKVIIDLVPNHSSDEHPWFRAALAAGPGSPERARYLFRDGSGPDGSQPPNNWPSVFGGRAWTRVTEPDGTLGQWYLHLFDTRQPDWDWTSEEVRTEFEAVLEFWLDRGVDGFRVDVAHSLIKADGLPDYELPESGVMAFSTPDGELAVGPTTADSPFWDKDGVHEIYRVWRQILDRYQPARILVAEAWVQPLDRLARYVRPDEMHQAFNFDYLITPWDATTLRAVVATSIAANQSVDAPTTWVLSNHDVVRHPSRFGLADQTVRPNGIGAGDDQPDPVLGLRRGRAASLTMLGLPGSAYLYQGEELGLPEHTALDDGLRQDPAWFRSGHSERGRDGCRVPLPWESDAPGLGFGPTGETWLPQPESFKALARDRQVGVPDSTLELYRRALALRREHGLGTGSVGWLDLGDDVVGYRNNTVTVVANMGSGPVPLPAGRLVVTSGELADDGALPPDTTAWLA